MISRRPSSSSLAGLERGEKHQVLLGITGSGKTFTIANVIQQSEQADAHPRAEQDARGAALRRDARALPGERRRVLRQLLRLLPARGVHPVDRHVHRQGRDHQRPDRPDAPLGDASRSSSRRDVIIVASVELHLRHRQRRELPRARHPARRSARSSAATTLLRQLVDIQYERNDVDFHRGTFRVRGDVVEVFPTYEQDDRDPHRVLRRRRSSRSRRSTRSAAA